jgi:hypothetical protein
LDDWKRGYTKFETIINVHHEFKLEYIVKPHDDESIGRWYELIRETGNVERRYSTGLPRISHEGVIHVRLAFICSPEKLTSRARTVLQIPRSPTLHSGCRFYKGLIKRGSTIDR